MGRYKLEFDKMKNRTQMGFAYFQGEDAYGTKFAVQESSIADDEPFIWLGGESRLHLSRPQVAELIPILQHFVDHGELPDELPDPYGN